MLTPLGNKAEGTIIAIACLDIATSRGNEIDGSARDLVQNQVAFSVTARCDS
jgi:hypothetical protein